jgi:hypothetical protein
MAFIVSNGDLLVVHNGINATAGVDLHAREGYFNVEQTCAGGTTGDPIPAGTVFASTQTDADAIANAMLSCVPV